LPENTPTTDATTPDSTLQKQAGAGDAKLREAAASQKSAGAKTAVSKGSRGISYADAGVDISAADKSKHRIKMLARKTFNKQVLSEIGGFGGLFALDLEKFPNPVLVSSADGVGTRAARTDAR
jgi:phosphoribosylformylglycinamidine cyclo-ligase